jgi:TP901 family phage tail tape measure protein
VTRETKIIVTGDGRGLDTALKKSERRIAGFGRKTIRTFKRVGSTINTISDRYLTRFNALLGGAAITMAGKKVIDFDARLARLAIQADRTGMNMLGLKKEIFDIAAATHQDPGELVDYIDAIVERTGDYESAVKTMKDAAIVASATGTPLAALGATVSNLMDKAKIAGEDAFNVLDILNVQAKSGAISLSKFAPLMERLVAASGRFNVEGVAGVRTLGAWVQLAKKGSGSAEQAATAIEGSIAEMLDPKKVAKMRKYGFNPIDVEASKKAGRSVMKELDVVLKGVIKATRGDEQKLGQIFGRESIRAITRLAQVFRDTGGFGEFEKFIEKGGDGATTMRDFAFWSEQSVAGIGDFMTQMSKFANKNLAGPIKVLTKSLDFLNKHPVITEGGIWALLGLGGVMGVSKIISGLGGMFGGKGKAGGAGGIMGGLTGPMPVYVVNKHLSMLPGQGWGLPGGGAAGTAAAGAGKFGKVARVAGKASLVGGAGLAGYEIATALGADKLGKFLGEKLYDVFNPEEARLLNNQPIVNVRVQVDEQGRPIVQTNSTKGTTEVKAPRGDLVLALNSS